MLIIFSVILIVCQVLIFLCPIIYQSELRANFLPLIALAVLWLNRYLFQSKSAVFSAILWVLFAVVGLVGFMFTLFMVFSYGDREQQEAPVIFGKGDGLKEIALIYHPGGSDLPRKVNVFLAERLSQNGFKVILYTAYAGLKIDPREFSAIGLSSPVYGGAIRPPLINFIKRTDLTGVKCFVSLTGGGKPARPGEIEKVQKLLESRGGVFIDGRKFNAADGKQTNDINAFIDGITDKLR